MSESLVFLDQPPEEDEDFEGPARWVDGRRVPARPEDLAQAEIDAAMTLVGLVPSAVTNFQARAVLLQMPGPGDVGAMFDAIDAALLAGRDAGPEGRVAWQAWEYANEITRGGVLVQQMAAAFGLDDAALDALFRAAAGIEA
jgi:hypothetical protein